MKSSGTSLSKEFWGVLSFELNLPALYELISGKHMGIGLKRFADWVMFPDKIPVDHQETFANILRNRKEHPEYSSLQTRAMNDQEEALHLLVMEILRLKHSGDTFDPSYLQHIYRLPDNVFYALSIQLVEKGYVSSHHMLQIYHRFLEGEQNEGSNYRNRLE